MTPYIFDFLYLVPIIFFIITLGYIIASYTIFPSVGLKQNLNILLLHSEMLKETALELEKSFGENINFQNLSRGFSELANYLETVNKFIVSIEILEKKVNKGNLFDSVKYINSLKGDTMKPLVVLRSFLSTRLSELEQSKGEMRELGVKVGGGEEALSLQSARTEPLIAELRDNVEKLDRMIEKMR